MTNPTVLGLLAEQPKYDRCLPSGNWFSPGQTAAHLGVTEQHLARLRCVGGSPPFVKIGRSVRYHVPTLERWLIERMQRNTSQTPEL